MLRQVLRLARTTIGSPQDGLNSILALPFDRAQLVMAALLVAIASVLVGGLETLLLRGPSSSLFAPNLTSPFVSTAIQCAVIVVLTLCINFGGRLFGGHGSFERSFLTVIWLQVMNLLVQSAGFFLMLVFAVPIKLVLMVSVVISIWLLVNFVATLHGFSSLRKVFGGVIGLYVAVSIVIGIILDLFGLVPGGI